MEKLIDEDSVKSTKIEIGSLKSAKGLGSGEWRFVCEFREQQRRSRMAIRIVNIKVDGKRVRNLGIVEVAKKVEKFINEMIGVEAEVEVSRYYGDRWYPIDWIEKRIKEEIEESLRLMGKVKK